MHTPRSPLPVLEVREPCSRGWDQMRGDARARFCTHCRKTVHNLSAMPVSEADRLLCESAGDICVRFTRRPDGGVATVEYDQTAAPAGWRRRSWRFWTGVGVVGAIFSGIASALVPGAFPRGPVTVMGGVPTMGTPRPWSTTMP